MPASFNTTEWHDQKKGFVMRSIGLGIFLLLGLVIADHAHATDPCPVPDSGVYGYTYSAQPCRFKTLEETESALHFSPNSAVLELAFPILGNFDAAATKNAMFLDYRTNGAAGTGASTQYEPAKSSTSSASVYAKNWPPTDSACQVGTCIAGQGCTNPSDEANRLQCEFAATWKSDPRYCWSYISRSDNLLQFGTPAVTTNTSTTGTLSYKPSSSTDYSHASVTILATTGCGYNTSGAGSVAGLKPLPNTVPAQVLTSQSFQFAFQKKIDFTCPVGTTVNPAASSTNNACYAGFNKDGVTPPSFQEPTGQCGVGNPCFPATGNKAAYEKGFRYGEIAFDLSYNSLRQTRPFGYIDRNWSHSFGKRILTQFMSTGGEIAAQGGLTPIYVQDEEAHIELYRPANSGDTVYRSTNTVGNVLHYYAAVGTTPEFWELYHTSGVIEVFDFAGRLQQIVYPDDPRKTLTLTYLGLAPTSPYPSADTSHLEERFWHIGQVTDGTGRYITLTYDSTPQMWLTAIVADDGVTTLMSFDYTNSDNVHRLTSTTQFGMTRHYYYNEAANLQVPTTSSYGPVIGYWLTGILDEEGQRFATYQYDDWGRAIASWHGSVHAGKVTLAYTSDTSAIVTMPLGDQTTYSYGQEPYRHPDTMVTGSGTSHYLYDPTTHRKTKTTDPNGNITTTEYSPDGRYETARTEGVGTPEQRRTETDWDAGTNRIVARRIYADPSGGIRTLETTTSYLYDPATGHLNKVTRTDPVTSKTRVTTYSYCATDDAPSGCVAGYLHTVDGPRTDVLDVTTNAYYTSTLAGSYHKGDLKTVTNALGQTVTFALYNARGQVLEQFDATGKRTDFSYTPRGWLQTSIVRAGPTGTSSSDAITTYAYDNVGNIKRITQPDGAYIANTYDDAERLTDTSDNLNNRVHYMLDAEGHHLNESVTTATGTIGRYLFRTYDVLGHLQKTLDASYSVTTSFNGNNDPTPGAVRGYDPSGNPTHFEDGLGIQTEQKYDALNRLKNIIQDYQGSAVTANASTQYARDARDNLLSVTDPDNLATTYTFDGLNNLTSLHSPDTGNTNYALYDAAGNRLSQTDANGVTSTYTYDALNRLTSISYPTATSLNVSYGYDTVNPECINSGATFAKGHLTGIGDASGQTTYCYGGHGNLRMKTQSTLERQTCSGVGCGTQSAIQPGVRSQTPLRSVSKSQNMAVFVTTYGYDAVDRLQAITYPSGAVVTYGRDSVGRVNAVTYQPNATTAAVNVVSNVTYYPFGPPNIVTYGNGRQLTKTYDQNYGIASIQSSNSNGLKVNMHLDVMGNIIGTGTAENANPPIHGFTYDPLYRLTGVQDSNAANLAGYTYNKTGDRLSETVAGQASTAYSYGSPMTGHRLQSIGGAARNYDPNGNTLTGALSYDARNRLSGWNFVNGQIDLGNDSVAYGYNGKGERVSKQTVLYSACEPPDCYPLPGNPTGWVTGTEAFSYDESGKLLGEYPGAFSPGIGTEYVYLDSTPIAVVRDGTLYYIETDQLGTPRVVIQPGSTSSSDTPVWTWNYYGDAFGKDYPNEDPASTGTQFTFNLRYPGQYFDQETGLNYNYFRDYEPGTGRYVQSDPIGVNAGPSTYSYAGSSPLDGFDPSGETRWSGTFSNKSLIISVGISYTSFDLTSECISHKKYNAKVLMVGPGVGVGLKWLKWLNGSQTDGTISMHNADNDINPDSLQGSAGVIGVGVEVGKLGPSYTKYRIGHTFSDNVSGTGLDIGASLSLGSATLVGGKGWMDCDCEDK